MIYNFKADNLALERNEFAQFLAHSCNWYPPTGGSSGKQTQPLFHWKPSHVRDVKGGQGILVRINPLNESELVFAMSLNATLYFFHGDKEEDVFYSTIMKLESLKSSKFEAFKGNELTASFSVFGGECRNTYRDKNTPSPTDSTDCDTSNTKILSYDPNNPKGPGCDFYDTMCPVGPSEGQGGIIK